jgi:polyisoprenoid-binding protein YceI
MRLTLVLLAVFAFFNNAEAQKYGSRDARVFFFSGTPIEDIEATNSKGSVAIDAATGKLQAAVLVTGFIFKSALMQEHFNENYMESKKFPKASFAGTIDMSKVKMTTDGVYQVKTVGELTMHGVTKPAEVVGTITVAGGKPTVKASFNVKPEDYGIVIPGPVKDKIAKTIRIDISGALNAI